MKHYILEIHSVELYSFPESLNQYVKVDITEICEGIVSRNTKVFTLEKWGDIVENRNYLS